MLSNIVTTKAGALFLFALLVCAGPAAAAAAPVSIAAVDVQAVLDKSTAGKAALTKMQASAAKEKKIMQKKVDALKALQKEIESQQMMMRPETLEAKQQELQKKKREFELYSRDTQANFQRSQGKVMRGLYQKIKKVVAAYGKEKGYTLVIEKSSTGASGPVFVYTAASIDVTAEIIKRFDLASR